MKCPDCQFKIPDGQRLSNHCGLELAALAAIIPSQRQLNVSENESILSLQIGQAIPQLPKKLIQY